VELTNDEQNDSSMILRSSVVNGIKS